MILRDRLRRLERARAGHRPAEPLRPIILRLAPGEDAAPHIAAAIAAGTHRRGAPVLAIRADWPAVNATGWSRPCA